MTIIQPNKHKGYLNAIIMVLAMVACGILLWSLSLYNVLVDTKHNAEKLSDDIHSLEAQNAELQSHLYGMLDTAHLEEVAEREGLVKEKGPQFLEVNVSVLWP